MSLNVVRPTTAGFALSALASMPASAADTFTFNTALVDTGRQYFTAPLRWEREDWAYFGDSPKRWPQSINTTITFAPHFATGSRAVPEGKDKNSAIWRSG